MKLLFYMNSVHLKLFNVTGFKIIEPSLLLQELLMESVELVQGISLTLVFLKG